MERLNLPALSGPVLFDFAARLFTAVFALAAIILAARWLTDLTAPRPVAELPSVAITQPDANSGLISRLFGTGVVQTQALEGLQLTGVFAGSRGGGFATFYTRTGNVSALPGEEIVPGVTLRRIENNRVILLASGVEKELRLRGDGASPVTSPPQTVTSGSSRPAQAED